MVVIFKVTIKLYKMLLLVYNICIFNLKGLCLGLGIFLVGLILDNTISYKSKKYLFKKQCFH